MRYAVMLMLFALLLPPVQLPPYAATLLAPAAALMPLLPCCLLADTADSRYVVYAA